MRGLCPRCLGNLAFALDDIPNASDQPSTFDSPPSTGLRRFGDYELLEEIARGGMGVVFKARQISLDRVVALKLLISGQFASPAAIARFRAEALTTARLRHPNIVPVYDVGEANGQPFLAMEFVAGQNLAEIVREHPLSASGAAELVQLIAEAVHYAHEEGILHRDLKPSNVLLDEFGQPRVTDFGIAKRLPSSELETRSADLTLSGQVLGSPSFIAPEQASGKRDDAGPASDVYSLGALLYHLLTGRAPFHAATITETLRDLVETDPVSPRLLNSSVPRDLETICLKCLEKEPRKRYTLARELADDLGRFLNDEPIQARPIGPVEKLWRWCQRKPALAAALTSAAVLMLAVVVISTVSAAKLKQADRIRSEELYRSYLDQIRAQRWSDQAGHRAEGLDIVAKAVAIRPSLELRNETIATLATMDVRPGRSWHPANTNIADWIAYYFDGKLERYALPAGPEGIRIRRVSDDAEVARLHDPTRNLPLIFGFSPDGRYLAATYREQKHWSVWDVASRRIVLDDSRCRHGIVFSRDGGRMAASHPDGQIVLYQLPSGDELASVEAGRPRSWLSLNASGDRVLGCDEGGSEIGVWNFTTGEALSLTSPDLLVNADWGGDELIAAGAATGRIHVWNASSGQLHRTIDAHERYVQQVLFNHRGDLLASTSWDGSTRFCNPWTGQLELTFPRNSQALQFSLDDRQFSLTKLALGPKSEFAFLEVQASPVVQRIEHGGSLKNAWSLSFSPDARRLAVAHAQDGGVRLYDTGSRRLLASLPDRAGRMVVFEPGRNSLLTGGPEGLSRWDLVESKEGPTNALRFGPRQPISPLKNIIHGALTPGGRWLACTQERETNQVWLVDLENPEKPMALGRHSFVMHVCISPDGQRVVSGNWQGMEGVKVWNTRSQTLERRLPMGGLIMAWSPDSRWFAASATQTNFANEHQIWDTSSWTLRYSMVLPHASGPVVFSPDSGVVAMVSEQRLIRLYEVETFRALATLEAPSRSHIAWIQFSPDGQRLAALELHHGIQLWDLAALRRELKVRGLDWDRTSDPTEDLPASTNLQRAELKSE